MLAAQGAAHPGTPGEAARGRADLLLVPRGAARGRGPVALLESVRGQRGEQAKGGAAKAGAAAYDDFIDPVRELLVKDWEREVGAIREAIRGDEERLRVAKSPKERQHFERLIREYKERLAKVEKNDPPYINLDALKKK